MGAYTSYKIMTEFFVPIAGHSDVPKTFNVMHRFSDWVWLRAQLHEAFPYLYVPAVPEKQQMGRFNQDFVELRQRALQRFMDRLTDHPVLATCDVLVKFLTLPADQFVLLRDGSSRGAGAAVKDGVSSGGAKMYRFIKGKVADARGTSTNKSRSAEDISFAELEAYLLGQAPLLTVIYNSAVANVSHWREQAQLLLEYGASLKAIGKTEGGPVGGAFASTGTCSWTGSTAAYEQSVEEAELWVERLADTVRNARGVKELVEERQRAGAELADATANVEKLRATITALGSAVTSSAAKDKVAAEGEMGAAQTAAAGAREYYDKVAASVIGEVERVKAVQKGEWRALLVDWATIQVRNNTRLAQAWERIVPELNAATAQEGGVPLAPILLVDTASSASSAETSTTGLVAGVF